MKYEGMSVSRSCSFKTPAELCSCISTDKLPEIMDGLDAVAQNIVANNATKIVAQQQQVSDSDGSAAKEVSATLLSPTSTIRVTLTYKPRI